MRIKQSGKYYYQILDGERLVGGASQLNGGKWIAVDTNDLRVKGSPLMDRPTDVRKWFENADS